MSTSMKIFRPWATVAENKCSPNGEERGSEEVEIDLSRTEVRSSAFTRVPEPHPMSEVPMVYEMPHPGVVAGYEDWSHAFQMLPFPTDNIAQNLSYLDPAYLGACFPEIYGNTKITKLKQRPKKFRCPHCKVSFSNNGQLKGHVRIHTGERPFKCDSEKCGKSFTRNEELTRHKRIHTGLRPFPCDQCGKRFGRKDHLKKHIRTHFPQPRYLDANLVSLYPILFGY